MIIKKCKMQDFHERIKNVYPKCPWCNLKIGKTYKEILAEKVALVPREKKQKLLDEIHSGKTIGEARKNSGIDDIGVAGEIILKNIACFKYLKKEVL